MARGGLPRERVEAFVDSKAAMSELLGAKWSKPGRQPVTARTSELTRTAHHEAGHAVAVCVRRQPIRRVSIHPNPEGDTLGHCALWQPPTGFSPDTSRDGKTRARIESLITVSLAGHAAEEKLRGRPVSLKYAGSGADWDVAIGLAEHMCRSEQEVEPYVRWLWVCTQDMIRLPAHWDAVTALASELLKRHYVGGRKARALINESIHPYAANLTRNPM